jgi:hypothetical protein
MNDYKTMKIFVPNMQCKCSARNASNFCLIFSQYFKLIDFAQMNQSQLPVKPENYQKRLNQFEQAVNDVMHRLWLKFRLKKSLKHTEKGFFRLPLVSSHLES